MAVAREGRNIGVDRWQWIKRKCDAANEGVPRIWYGLGPRHARASLPKGGKIGVSTRTKVDADGWDSGGRLTGFRELSESPPDMRVGGVSQRS